MPFVLNFLAAMVLFMIHLAAFLRRQPSTIGLAVRMNLLINFLFAVFKMLTLRSGQLSAGNSLPDALLLSRHARIRGKSVAVDSIHRGDRWVAMIDRSELAAVVAGVLLMCQLIRRGLEMLLV